MTLPFFYTGEYQSGKQQLILEEDTSRHIIQVLRMKAGEHLNLTDGKGNLLTCEVTGAHKKNCAVQVVQTQYQPQPEKKVTLAVSLLKNASRFEWLLEKATEIGVSGIIPLLCDRTEKERFRFDRMNAICISAMLQSQQCWLPLLHLPTGFDAAVKSCDAAKKLIAHCEAGEQRNSISSYQPVGVSTAMLIGPEGDFTKQEIELALQLGFLPVSLGQTRLRTETAAVVAAALLMS